jgi:NAD(P)-dependent dehydrogenase (short-subunit alcohol dehydrogenase family)
LQAAAETHLLKMPSKFITKLQGQRVVIFGGTSGIGFAVAEGAIEYGAAVLVSSSSPDKVARAVERLRTSYPEAADRVSGEACDLADEANIEANLEALFNKATNNGTNKLSHIVYTAGAPAGMGVADFNSQVIGQSQVIRVIVPMIIAKKFIPRFMHISPQSSFSLTSGAMVYKPAPGWALSAIGGNALAGAILSLAVETKPVRVNVVVPGAIETELLAPFPAELKETFKSKTLVGTLGKPEDTAEAYLYLMKDNFITGATIHTNGGFFLV